LLAHLCLGTVEAARFSANLYGMLGQDAAGVSYGPLDRLRALGSSNPNHLSDCDVPLALLYWSQTHIDFVDLWSVRRRLHTLARAAHPPFPTLDRRGAEAEATLLQFQQQLAHLTRPGTSQILLAQMELADHFRFLPAVGVVPERVGVARGFTHLKFFKGLTFREPVFIEGARLRELFRMGVIYEAIDLNERELIWLYRVRQNRQQAAGASQAYLIFSSGFIPYQGDPQFDLARWSFSNYGPGVSGSRITSDGPALPGSIITGG
jgi:hypothetical protein